MEQNKGNLEDLAEIIEDHTKNINNQEVVLKLADAFHQVLENCLQVNTYSDEIIAQSASKLIIAYFIQNSFPAAEKIAKLALTHLKEKDGNMQGLIYFNLASMQKSQLKMAKALKYAKKAFNIDEEHALLYFEMLYELQDYEEILRLCSSYSFKNPVYRNLANIYTQVVQSHLDLIKLDNFEAIFSDLSFKTERRLLSDLYLKQDVKKGLQEKKTAIECAKTDNAENPLCDIAPSLIDYFKACVLTSRYQEGLQALEGYFKEFPTLCHGNPLLLSYAVLFNLEANKEAEANRFLKQLKAIHSNNTYFPALCLMMVSNKLDSGENNCNELIKFINPALEVNPGSSEAEILKIFLEEEEPYPLLDQKFNGHYLKSLDLKQAVKPTPAQVEQAAVHLEQPPVEISAQHVDSPAPVSNTVLKTLIETTPPTLPQADLKRTRAHQFCIKHQGFFQKRMERPVLNEKIPATTWIINGLRFSYKNEHSRVKPTRTPKAFAIISLEVLKLLDPLQQEQCLNALSSDGNKNGTIITDFVTKLKINADLRLFTLKGYKNADGNILYILDTIGNHKTIGRQKKQLEIIDLAAQEQLETSALSI